MKTVSTAAFGLLACLFLAADAHAEEVLFEDTFDDGLSPKWQLEGLDDDDWRIRDGGLELRVQPVTSLKAAPKLTVLLPIAAGDTVAGSVEVTLLDNFTEPDEQAALLLLDEEGIEFRVKKQRIDSNLMFAPGNYVFRGESGEEGDPQKYNVVFTPATDDAGPLRIIVRGDYAYSQVGPSGNGKYLNFFHSAIRRDSKQRGFGLTTMRGPDDEEHWVRFDNFRVVRH
ncbi:hypothetical protein Mal4_28520 [Maioricimonas rarisocia]|uniref:Beta-xylosidase C-terminal Concanavalin A-like domain-containing protein n=1 Tax=Maioricimonas rarisocia TaxID=2528026 RepID=A0A517Z7R2_9PLAN|nr:hypothetical protein [Maioricimonas rarisocia]QDU38523.1 hypothetical protein Mal4_28520 [Maioricimonas rarisocia]